MTDCIHSCVLVCALGDECVCVGMGVCRCACVCVTVYVCDCVFESS